VVKEGARRIAAAILPCPADRTLIAASYLGSQHPTRTRRRHMPPPAHPEDAHIRFRLEAAPMLYLAGILYEDTEMPEQTRVLCEAVFQGHEWAELALEEAVRWSEGRTVARG
jgi:hypothetical protein